MHRSDIPYIKAQFTLPRNGMKTNFCKEVQDIMNFISITVTYKLKTSQIRRRMSFKG